MSYQADFDAMLAFEDHSESVSYTPDGGSATPMLAFVKDGDVDGGDILGVVAEGLDEPKLVQVSKTDVPTVTEHADTVAIGATTYQVKKIIKEDPAAFWLYCLK